MLASGWGCVLVGDGHSPIIVRKSETSLRPGWVVVSNEVIDGRHFDRLADAMECAESIFKRGESECSQSVHSTIE